MEKDNEYTALKFVRDYLVGYAIGYIVATAAVRFVALPIIKRIYRVKD